MIGKERVQELIRLAMIGIPANRYPRARSTQSSTIEMTGMAIAIPVVEPRAGAAFAGVVQ